jgi:TatD DNase family protein
MIDSHAHLHVKDFDEDRPEVFARLREAGVSRVLEVGIDREGAAKALKLAARYPEMLVAAGLHPHDSMKWDEDYRKDLLHIAGNRKVVALGEMGLDFYRDLSPRDAQDRCFREQLAVARETGLPVIFHVRDAEVEFLRVVDEEGAPARAVVHAFGGHRDFAKACLERGFWLGIGGVLTYKNSNLPEVLSEHVPVDRILMETDCPWLTPHPFRGKRNEPAMLVHVREKLMEVYGFGEKEMDAITDYSFDRFLGIE